jgi:hypothetical protein
MDDDGAVEEPRTLVAETVNPTAASPTSDGSTMAAAWDSAAEVAPRGGKRLGTRFSPTGRNVVYGGVAGLVVPRRSDLILKLAVPAGPHAEAVLSFDLLGLSAGCNLDLSLCDASGRVLWRSVPDQPFACRRTATGGDIALSLMRSVPLGLRLEAMLRAGFRVPAAPLFYEIPASRLPPDGAVSLTLRRLLPPPVLLTRASLATSPHDPAQQVTCDGPLAAYADRIGVTPGDSLALRVHAPAGRFDLTIVRYGKIDRNLRHIEGLVSQPQRRPRAAYRLGAGWPEAWRLRVDEGFAPGLYGVRLSDPAGGAMTVPLVVRPSAPHAPLLVLASTNTWAAYNEWGGASLYYWRQADALGRDRARVVSRLRPNPAADPDRGEIHLTRGLVELVRWLEASGYAYDLATDEDVHADPELFGRYRCVMTDPHAEYWTEAMRDGLERFFAGGGGLLYLSGNGLYWQTRASADGIEVVKPWGVFADGEAGGLWADRGASETKLTGLAYTPRGRGTYAPYRVLYPDHWVFAGTGVIAGAIFGARGRFGAASGLETDKINRHTPKGVARLARGCNPGGGGADLIYFERDDGGRVFATGSVAFAGALADDAVVDRITRNVLDRFLASPPCARGDRMIRSGGCKPIAKVNRS